MAINPIKGALMGGALLGPMGATAGGLIGLNPFSGPAPPGSPDFRGAAEATAEGNLAGAEAATLANRISQFNPYGSTTWTQGPGGWEQRVAFSPEQQQLYDISQQGKMDILGADMPTFGANRQRVMEAMLSRVTGDIDRAREAKRSQLIAQGIPVGSEAYNREMEQLNRRETDARQQAEIAATQQAGTEYGAELAGRGQRAGEIGAFTPRLPQFTPFYQQQAVPGADYLGAIQQQAQFDLGAYNAEQAQQNAILQGLFGLGAAGILA